jgi:hypothetical protein
MSNRFNNKKLLFLLGGLVAVLLLTLIVKIPKENATLKSRILELDTLQVTKILLYPKGNDGLPVEFSRQGFKWTVKQGDIVSAAREGAVENMFIDAVNLKPQSLATKDKDKWEEYELTDSLATRIKFLNSKEKILGDLMIGNFTYKQVEDPYGGYGGNNIRGTSYVRLYDEKDVYSVEGFLSFTFNGKFDDWRDKTFVISDKNNITSIRFIYPVDSSFVLLKEGTAWSAGGLKADSLAVQNYLSTLGSLNGQYIKDKYQPVTSPVSQIMVEGNNLTSFTIKCFRGEGDEYILNSSLNPDVYFTSARDGIYDRLFKSQGYFLGK